MAWNQWMVLEPLPAETEFLLRTTELEMREAISKEPDRVIAFASAVIRQNTERGRLLEAAMRRILELETREALEGRDDREHWRKVAREVHPVPWWVRMLWVFYPLLSRRPRQ
jgi:hypothetical protein